MKFTELNIQWKKLKLRSDIWSYLDAQGTISSYTSDFFLPEFNVYLDPKGYWWGDDRNKIKLVRQQHSDKKLIIVEKEMFNLMLKAASKNEFAALV